jgi:hypothetical protein
VSLLAISILNDTTQKGWPLWHGPCVPVIQDLQKNCRCLNSPIHPNRITRKSKKSNNKKDSEDL